MKCRGCGVERNYDSSDLCGYCRFDLDKKIKANEMSKPPQQKDLRIESEHALYVAKQIYDKAKAKTFRIDDANLCDENDTPVELLHLSDLAEICQVSQPLVEEPTHAEKMKAIKGPAMIEIEKQEIREVIPGALQLWEEASREVEEAAKIVSVDEVMEEAERKYIELTHSEQSGVLSAAFLINHLKQFISNKTKGVSQK